MTSWLLSLGSVGAVSLVSLAGLATLSLSETGARRLAALLVSFAVGALLGDAFIHLIPQAFEQDAADPDAVLVGLLGVNERTLARKAGKLILATYDAPEPEPTPTPTPTPSPTPEPTPPPSAPATG